MNTEILIENLPFLLPLLLVQLALAVFALIHVLKHNKYHVGNRALWCFVVIFFSIIGPVAYFIWGRDNGEDEEA